MGKYFDRFPKIVYSLNKNAANPIVVTDNTFALRIDEKYVSDRRYFYTQIIKDGVKPEDLAYMVYGDPQMHWLILHINKCINPRFDWPLSQRNFELHIVDKYGSVANAYSTIAKYYKVTTRYSSTLPEEPSVEKTELTQEAYANVALDLVGSTYSLPNGETVRVIVDRQAVTAYDWELEQNDAKREVILIQKDFVEQVKSEFDNFMKTTT